MNAPESTGRVRLFSAIDLPRPVREALAAWSARELTDPALRVVPAENLHVTVCFLGWTQPERVFEAGEILRAIAPRPVPIRLAREPVARPPRRPSLYAIEADSPAAAALAADLTSAFARAGLAQPESRPFWPHVTVARVRPEPGRRGGGGRRRRRVEDPPGPLPVDLGGEFRAVRLSLYRSMMRSDGSSYVPLCNVNLR